MLECVPNVSEGRDLVTLDALAAACGRTLLDRHVDPDHHRSVFTLAGPGAGDAADAARALADAVAARLDLRPHTGVHPAAERGEAGGHAAGRGDGRGHRLHLLTVR